MTVAKPGNPHGASRSSPAEYKVTFKLDQETYDRLRELEAASGPNVRGRRSRVIREAIWEKHEHSKK